MFSVNTTQNAVKLSVETAVPKPEQETAQHGDGHTEGNQNTFLHNTAAIKYRLSDHSLSLLYCTLAIDMGCAVYWFQKQLEHH